MRHKPILLIVITIITALMFLTQSAYAQSDFAPATQLSSDINLEHLAVKLTYPSNAQPGQPVTVNVLAQAKNNFQLVNLDMQISFASSNSFHQVSDAVVASNLTMKIGDQINKDVQATIPSDAPRTSLLAIISENTTTVDTYIEDHSAAPQPYMTISYSYVKSSDNAVTPLTYIQAKTPEFMAMQTQFQVLQTQFKQVQQTLDQTRVQLQGTIDQQNTTIDQLNQQLTSTNRMLLVYQALSLGLGIMAVVLSIVMVLRQKKMQ